MRKCEMDGCTNNHRAKGLCIVHYNHLVRYGESQGKFESKFREAERERIIKLLETDCKNGSIEFAIALIKGEGENK